MNELQNEATVAVLRDYPAEIVEILCGTLAPSVMREKILDYHENDIAAAMEAVTPEARKKLYSVLNAETLSVIFEYAENRRQYINELNIRKKLAVLSRLEPAVTVEYLAEMERSERQTVMDLMDEDAKREVLLLWSFDEDEIGSRMTTNYITIHDACSIKQAMNELVEQAAENDNLSTLYVIDSEEHYLGAIDLKDLIIARRDTALSDITVTSYPYVYATEQIESCIERIRTYSEESIPVLDAGNKLVGVLLSQDITQLVDDEMSDDYAKLAGLSAEEDLNEPLKKSIGKRLPWLMILLGLGLLVSSVVGMFEAVVSQLTLIVCFQSLILGMAGNAGTQSLAVTIRVLTDEALSTKQKLFLIGKEARVGLLNGLMLGLLSFGLIGGYIMLFKQEPAFYAFSVSLCTGIALSVSVLLSGIMGTVIPIIFKKLKIDPAVASGPLITTVNDLVAVLSYYGLAWVLLIRVLGITSI